MIQPLLYVLMGHLYRQHSLFCSAATSPFSPQENLLVPEKTSHLTHPSLDSEINSLPSNVIKAQIFETKAHVPTEHNLAFKEVSKVLPTNPLFWMQKLEDRTFLHYIF